MGVDLHLIVGQLSVSAHHPNWVIVAPEGAGRSAFAKQTLLSGDRLLDAEADPYDGCLYVLTKSRDNRGSPSPEHDRILKYRPR